MSGQDPRALVRAYHDQTKHHFHRFARSLGYLDWETQPNPFRAFDGAPAVDLIAPFLAARKMHPPAGGPGWAEIEYDTLADGPSSPRLLSGLSAVSVFLRYSLGLSAWKQAGPSRWALRVNPSSGNLHPTEGYVVLPPGMAGSAGVFHYAPDRHALERRCEIDPGAWSAAAGDLPAGSFLAALSSIHWREAWKYGERAFRYCQHDTGHAIAAMRVAAALMGWHLRVAAEWSSGSLASLLGLDRSADFADAEPEEPTCVMLVTPGEAAALVGPRLADAARSGAWTGKANRLSSDHVQWDWIDTVAQASRRPDPPLDVPAVRIPERMFVAGPPTRRPSPGPVASAAKLLLQRRSAQSLDGSSSMDLDPFVFMLRRVMPDAGLPFDALATNPRVHLVLFVHRVSGLTPGIYLLVRRPGALDMLREALQGDFAWSHPDGVPHDLPLYLLAPVDCRRIARQLSCTQDIAADGYFSLGMLAEFDTVLDADGAASYRGLFWETGAIGQVLYLEAEAAGARGTGIGCFFDDGVHDLLGIRNHRLQSVYHFTVGVPVDDPRLTTSPGYDWDE